MLITVRVRAGEKNESVREVANRYEVVVREEPAHNLANARVLALLASKLGVPRKELRIVKGHRSPSKIIERLSR